MFYLSAQHGAGPTDREVIMRNHFHVVSYTLDNRLADNVEKATRRSADDLAKTFRDQYGHGRSVAVWPCDNRAHKNH